YPGWYQGRTVHIHVKVHLGGTVVHTGQLIFPDSLTDKVYTASPYDTRGERDVRRAPNLVRLLDEADLAVRLDDPPGDLRERRDLLLAHRLADLVGRHSLALEVPVDQLAVLNDHDRIPFDDLAEARGTEAEI